MSKLQTACRLTCRSSLRLQGLQAASLQRKIHTYRRRPAAGLTVRHSGMPCRGDSPFFFLSSFVPIDYADQLAGYTSAVDDADNARIWTATPTQGPLTVITTKQRIDCENSGWFQIWPAFVFFHSVTLFLNIGRTLLYAWQDSSNEPYTHAFVHNCTLHACAHRYFNQHRTDSAGTLQLYSAFNLSIQHL